MRNKKLDFWGITRNYTFGLHIPTYFISLNSGPINNKKFWDFVYDTIDNTKFDNWNCIELKGAALKKAKEYNGYKGKRNIKAFFFWGLAAT